MNIIRIGDNELVPLDYSDLLQKILTVLKNQQTKNPFAISQTADWLNIDIDEIAFQVAKLQIDNPLGSYSSNARSATVNFSPAYKELFSSQVQQIRDCLKQHIESSLAEQPNTSLEEYITSLITDLSTFHGQANKIGFTYNFDKYSGLQKQRLSLRHNQGTSLLKFHKLTIKVENSRQFQAELKASLNNFIDIQFAANSEDGEEVSEILNDLVEDKDKKSDFYKLQRLMNQQALGKVQREAKIRYLEFILENVGEDKDAIYLEDLIRRLRLIEQYINDEQKPDGHYQVNYAGHSFNYKDIFSTSDAFDMLPIIPLIAGQLGETTDEERGELQFIFGLKFKFNGKIQTEGGREVFERNLNLLDPDSKEHQAGLADPFTCENFAKKVLKIAFLYYFIFARNFSSPDYEPGDELNYDPISSFEEKALRFLQESDESKKQKLFRNIKTSFERFNVAYKINLLKQLIQKNIRNRKKIQSRTYRIQIGVKQGILERDFRTISQRSTLFKPVFNESSRQQYNYNEALRYISVSDPNADPSFLCTLPASIQISEIEYFSTPETQNFSMEYDIAGIRTIPVLLFPQEDRCIKISKNNFQKQKLLVFSYDHQRLKSEIFNNGESPQAFVYQVTFSLLAYTCLKLLLATQKRLFIPIIRLQLNDQENNSAEEDFMRSLFSSISHLLNEEHRSSSQGFCITNLNSFKIRNGLTSLYSVLPKKFQFSDTATPNQVDKLAIIVVSSRESDVSKKGGYKISNFLGEVMRVQRQPDNSIRLQLIKTFSDNYSSQRIHNNPTVLLDEVSSLYRQGYRHIFYIAKAPYSRTLNMTRTEEDEELFFMSKAIISSFIKDKEDIKIYPIFFDKYFVVKRQTLQSSSLYIQDISELTSLVEDPSKQAVVFFNLFNGISVGNDNFYNGVISYATLLNIYEDILDDKDIRMGLMYDGLLKHNLLQYLTLFHFSRYEAAPTKSRNISLKLDPYQNIIGDDSVGAKSIFKHMTGGVKFNSLAFLTEVRRVINQQENKER